MTPLALTDRQLSIIRSAAKTVPPDWRSRMLEATADRLIGIDVLNDDDVENAVSHVLYSMFRKVKA